MRKRLTDGTDASTTDVKRLAAVTSSLAENTPSISHAENESKTDVRRLALVASGMAEENEAQELRQEFAQKIHEANGVIAGLKQTLAEAKLYVERQAQEHEASLAHLQQLNTELQNGIHHAQQLLSQQTRHHQEEAEAMHQRVVAAEAKMKAEHDQYTQLFGSQNVKIMTLEEEIQRLKHAVRDRDVAIEEQKRIHGEQIRNIGLEVDQHGQKNADLEVLRANLAALNEEAKKKIQELQRKLALADVDARRMAELSSSAAEIKDSQPPPPGPPGPDGPDGIPGSIDRRRFAALLSSLSERPGRNDPSAPPGPPGPPGPNYPMDVERLSGVVSNLSERPAPVPAEAAANPVDLRRLMEIVSSLAERPVHDEELKRQYEEKMRGQLEAIAGERKHYEGEIARVNNEMKALEVLAEELMEGYRRLQLNHNLALEDIERLKQRLDDQKMRHAERSFVDAVRVASLLSNLAERKDTSRLVEELKEQKSVLEAKLQGLAASMGDLENQVRGAIELLEGKNEELAARLANALRQLQENQRGAQDGMNERQTQIDALRAELAGLREALAEAQRRADELPPPANDDEKEALHQSLLAAELARDNALQRIVEIQARLAQVTEQRDTALAQAEQMHAQLMAALQEKQAIQEQLDEARNRIAQLEAQPVGDDNQAEIARLEALLMAALREKAELEARLAELNGPWPHFNVDGQSSWDIAKLIATREAFYSDVRQNLPRPFLPLLDSVFTRN